MKKTIAILITLVFILIAAVPMVSSGGGPTTELIAGHEIDIGGVNVWTDANNIYVEYITTGDWYLLETDVHVGTVLGDIPHAKNGNPIPGRFAYKMFFEATDSAQQDVRIIPIDGFSGTVIIAAHAVVFNHVTGQTHSAWGDGPLFVTKPKGNFGTYFTYNII